MVGQPTNSNKPEGGEQPEHLPEGGGKIELLGNFAMGVSAL